MEDHPAAESAVFQRREDKVGFLFRFFWENSSFLPAAKPTGHRKVRVVVVVGGGTTLRS